MPRVRNPLRILYLDIETTPHEGTFWNLFPKYIPINQLKKPTEMLCWAAKWEGEKDVIYRKVTDADHIGRMHELLDEADAVCHYNGKAFDVKHINREFAKAGYGPPSPFAQIDLLTVVRQNFKLASNKLDFVCRYFGLGNKVQHVGIELWYGCMEGDERDWKIMEKYNRRDVVLLPKLYKFLRPWIKSHPNAGLATSAQKPTCSTCSSTNVQSRGTYATKAAVYKRYHCQNCGTWLRTRTQESKTSENVLVRAN
jgi:DNA polymerase elongation subunit (family B)